jgi:hypothetical protein
MSSIDSAAFVHHLISTAFLTFMPVLQPNMLSAVVSAASSYLHHVQVLQSMWYEALMSQLPAAFATSAR